MGKTKEGLSAFQSVLVVLLMIGGAGAFLAWNFEQNEEFRPFKGYSDQGLEELIGAYEEKFEQVDSRYEKISGSRPEIRDPALLGEGIEEFARVQQISERTRKAGHQVSYAMADQKNLKREKWIREHAIEHFWNTATTF